MASVTDYQPLADINLGRIKQEGLISWVSD